MRIRYLATIFTALAFSFLLIGGLNQDTFGQGKGHGGGNPHGGPPGQEKHGGGDGGGNRGGGPPPGRGGGNGGGGGWQRQQVQAPQQVFRQQAPQQQYRMPPGQARRQERVSQPVPQQVWRQQQAPQQQVWRQQQQQAYRMPPGQAKKMERQQQAYNPAPVYQERGRGIGNGRWKREERQVQSPWGNGGGFVPPGQIRSAEVHERNAIRKAEREGRNYQQDQPYYAPYVPAPNYRYNQRYDNNR